MYPQTSRDTGRTRCKGKHRNVTCSPRTGPSDAPPLTAVPGYGSVAVGTMRRARTSRAAISRAVAVADVAPAMRCAPPASTFEAGDS